MVREPRREDYETPEEYEYALGEYEEDCDREFRENREIKFEWQTH